MDTWLKDFIATGGGREIVAAVVVLAITIVAARYAVRLVRKLLSSDGAPLPSSSLIENIVRIAIWAVGGSFILSVCFNINVGGLITALGVGGVALSLGLQDTISNFIGGLQVTLMKIVKPGDHIKIGSTEGMVLDVTWRQTVVKDFENNVHTIPNSSINSGEVEKIEPPHLVATMLSFTNDTRDLDATIRTMEALAKEAVEQVAELEKDPWILLTQIGEYGTWAKMRFVLKDMEHVREARDAALRAVSPYTRVNPEDIHGEVQ
jgi:small-conductance mechanosensitive channel